MEERKHYRSISAKQLEVVKADIEAALAVKKLRETSDNLDLRCIEAYLYSQAIEKALKGIIKTDNFTEYNELDIDGTRKIRKSHNINELISKACETRSDMAERNPFIYENSVKLQNFYNMMHGFASIEEDELNALSAATISLVKDLEEDELIRFPDRQKTADYLQVGWDNREKLGLKITDIMPEITTNKTYKPHMSVNPKEHGLIKASLEAANAMLEACGSTQNHHLICLAAYQYKKTLEMAFKYAIKAENDELFSLDNADKDQIVKYTQSMRVLIDALHVCGRDDLANIKFVKDNAIALSEANKLRYGRRSISISEVNMLAAVTKDVVATIEKDFERNFTDKAYLKKFLKSNWERRKKAALTMPKER